MFERYTERARRVIFFARYEASQYGSPDVESEHFLLGLLREDLAFVRRFLGPTTSVTRDIRAEIERQITRRERISTSMEIPLTDECKKILNLAGEEAEKLAHPHVGTEHIVLGILGVEGSLAARLLRARGLKPQAIRELLVQGDASLKVPPKPSSGARSEVLNSFFAGLKRYHGEQLARLSLGGIEALCSVVAGLRWYDWKQLAPFFAQNTHFVDSMGKRWIGHKEMEKQFEILFAPYAKRNATFLLEGVYSGPVESVVASVLWENVTFGGETTRSAHRMTVILVQEGGDWAILLLQVTPVIAN